MCNNNYDFCIIIHCNIMFILCGFDCACELAFIMIYTLMNHGYNIVTRLDCITLQFDNLGGTFDLISPLSYEFDKC